jgi:hypothetical protein
MLSVDVVPLLERGPGTVAGPINGKGCRVFDAVPLLERGSGVISGLLPVALTPIPLAPNASIKKPHVLLHLLLIELALFASEL